MIGVKAKMYVPIRPWVRSEDEDEDEEESNDIAG